MSAVPGSRRVKTAGLRLAPPRWATGVILGIVGVVFAVPILSMVEFTLRDREQGYSANHWLDLLAPENPAAYAPLWTGLTNSLILAVVTVAIVLVLLTPTMILVQLRFPKLTRAFEFLCLLPISIPAIVLVVGLAPVYLVIGRTFGTGIWPLAFAYGITVLPFAYRAIQANLEAVDLTTLANAARTLGASWPRIVIGVLAPNLRVGLMLASLISIAVVLGEFTIASLLNRQNLQTALLVVSKIDPYVAVIMSLLSLVLVFVLLLIVDRIARRVSALSLGRA
jgi:putative spermidine/putrescine transport system permease protein